MSVGGRIREVKDAGYGECKEQWEGSQKGGRLLCSSLDGKGACGFAVDLFSPVMLYTWWALSCFPFLANSLDDVTGDFFHC